MHNYCVVGHCSKSIGSVQNPSSGFMRLLRRIASRSRGPDERVGLGSVPADTPTPTPGVYAMDISVTRVEAARRRLCLVPLIIKPIVMCEHGRVLSRVSQPAHVGRLATQLYSPTQPRDARKLQRIIIRHTVRDLITHRSTRSADASFAAVVFFCCNKK